MEALTLLSAIAAGGVLLMLGAPWWVWLIIAVILFQVANLPPVKH